MSVKAILLLAFGGPCSLDEVEFFLTNLLKGVKPFQDHLERVKERYRLIGGSSPIIKITLDQATALERRLNKRGHLFKSYIGMRYNHPFIKESVEKIIEDGLSEVIAIPMSPFRSSFSTEAYKSELNLINENLKKRLKIHFIEGWHSHPLFLEAIVEKILEGLSNFNQEERKNVHLIFTAHSLPESIIGKDFYIDDMKETIDRVLGRINPIHWHVAFQSRGFSPERWLSPDLCSVLSELSKINATGVLIVPIGFVSDHIEVLYDIDIFYKKKAESLGLTFRRTESLNASERFMDFLANLVEEELGKEGT